MSIAHHKDGQAIHTTKSNEGTEKALSRHINNSTKGYAQNNAYPSIHYLLVATVNSLTFEMVESLCNTDTHILTEPFFRRLSAFTIAV